MFTRRKARFKRHGGASGFTLIELLGVIVVLGLIVTVVTVNWRAILPRSELNSSVRALAATLQSTRSDAIARSTEFKIQYDLPENRYRIITPFKLGGGFAVDESERLAFEWIVLPDSVRFSSVIVDGYEYSDQSVFVRFDPLGAASDHAVVLEQQPDGNKYTIEVQALTGLIDFKEGVHLRQPPDENDFE